MAEAPVRMYGPNTVSYDTASPTTLFTVPPRQTYFVRSLSIVGYPVTGDGSYLTWPTPSLILGRTNLSQDNIVSVSSLTPVRGGYTALLDDVSIPFTEGEVCVAAITGLGSTVAWNPVGATTTFADSWNNLTTTDATTITGMSYFTPGTLGYLNFEVWANMINPTSVFWLIGNSKAASPDAVSSMKCDILGGPGKFGEVVTGASTTVRSSIWANEQVAPVIQHASGNSTNIVWGGTWTSAAVNPLMVQGSSYRPGGVPSTSDIIAATASATGTTETALTVTTTPVAGNCTYQILMVSQAGGTTMTGSTTQSGAYELLGGGAATPTTTYAAYLIDPPLTNPSITAAAAGTTWAIALAEVYKGGAPYSLTVSGVKVFG